MKLLFTILALCTGSLFATALGTFVRFRRHQQWISHTMLRDSFEMSEPLEQETLGSPRD